MKQNILAWSMIVLLMTSFAACEPLSVKNATIKYTFPAEWEQHEGTWLIWPHDYGIITPEYVDMIDDIWLEMTKALHTGEKVHIVAYNAEERTRITTLLEEAGVDLAQVDFVLSEIDQFWARDCGPMFATDSEGKPVILDWGFNGYGRMNKFGPDVEEDLRWELAEFAREEYLENFVKDDRLAKHIASAIGIEQINLNGFVLEGGAIESDGCGVPSSPQRVVSSMIIEIQV